MRDYAIDCPSGPFSDAPLQMNTSAGHFCHLHGVLKRECSRTPAVASCQARPAKPPEGKLSSGRLAISLKKQPNRLMMACMSIMG